VKREQIRHLLEMSEQGANIDVFDRDRIMRVVRFAEKTAGDSMIPMAEMTVIDHKSTTRKALRMAYQKGHFRLPVFEGKATNITGVVSFTLWNLMDPQLAQLPLADLVKPVHFITPHQLLDELLPELQKREDHMVIVVDEFGSAIGMLTLEDVLEEVTGEVINVGFNFEAQVARHAYQIENPQEGVFIMDARTPIVEVAEALNTPLSSAKAHTIGGMVTATLRHIPKPGESVLAGNFRFVVVQANERSVIQIRAEIIGG
ncbi:MAG: transporter associated domain-containing protein, partial [bacterium]|nr:transporter associated domain-containing protein [bacterium]